MTEAFPARIVGGYRSGKTTALQKLAATLPEPLVVCATEAAAAAFGFGATTFWGLAADVLARHDRPVRVLSTAEQRARFDDPALAHAVCHYQASFLGLEELRTHAHAAGSAAAWETVAAAAESYLTDLSARGEADWAGVLVQASLLLRDERVLAAERSRWSHVLVDDFEAASFACNRLLTQLAGFGGPVAVAGNPANDVWRHLGGSPRYLDRFPRRFGAAGEATLSQSFPAARSGSAVLVLEPGGDPWLPRPDGPIPVALSTSLSWAEVQVVAGASTDAVEKGPYDLDLLAGPDVPDELERRERRRREDEARLALARSRAVAVQTVVQPPSTAST
ncbi:MAG TPA: UvrD-helicase domain-containing protein [Acidimicrobiales bacterium]|nr:UvrD-helicase domain-containing protein [Acidimicrobiales bacterium]